MVAWVAIRDRSAIDVWDPEKRALSGMLRQALGVTEFSSAMTSLQMLTITVFVAFYIPCLPTLTTLKKRN
ncbi:MAG: hypothetical protein A2X25_10325 [Chloroflexi bacterium GWB2_49_20]|nr:MAG: hypothetical protein A2X25_10325 [Chloroflexi bacterium GWB2_49_20]OGN79040.1 MAG: hypothetical protein A2X26_01030 [Chloroflexi bacterium GWC2_49_37]OGN86199.1 MAG: hypothetical protein A2X27_04750 [Chloroflexi bacterium GWD2_49_16]